MCRITKTLQTRAKQNSVHVQDDCIIFDLEYDSVHASPWQLAHHLKIHTLHPLIKATCAKFYKNILTVWSLSCSQGYFHDLYHVHKVTSTLIHCDLDVWPPKSIDFVLSSWASFAPCLIKKLYLVHKFISTLVHCDLDLWPPKSIRFILSSW